MRLAYSLALPLVALTTLGCEAHNQAPPPGSLTSQALVPMVDSMAQQLTPSSQRIAPIYESATTEDDGHVDWNVPLQMGQCYTFVGVGGGVVKQLYLYLWNPKENRVATEKPEKAQVALRHCPTENGLFHLQAKTGEGYGPIAVGIYAEAGQPGMAMQPLGGMPALPPPPPVDLSALVDGQATSAAPGAGRVGNFFTGNTAQGDRNDWAVALDAGRCYWFIGAGETSVQHLSLYLWEPAGSRVTDNRSRNNQAVIGHCPKVSGMFKVEAKVEKGSGAYQMGIYVR